MSCACYATRDDLELQYGRENVKKWADLENLGDADTIEERITWALEQASAMVNDKLRDGPYSIPFDCPPPSIIKRMCASQAGVLLYESRGVVDSDDQGGGPTHQLKWQVQQFDRNVADILGYRIKLDVATVGATYPQIVKLDPPTPVRRCYE